MTFDQAIAELAAKLPAGMAFLLERTAGREADGSRFDRFVLTTYPFAIFGQKLDPPRVGVFEFPGRCFKGDVERLDQAAGALLDQVATWRRTGEAPVECERCRDTGVDPDDGHTCECKIPF